MHRFSCLGLRVEGYRLRTQDMLGFRVVFSSGFIVYKEPMALKLQNIPSRTFARFVEGAPPQVTQIP